MTAAFQTETTFLVSKDLNVHRIAEKMVPNLMCGIEQY